MRRLTSHGLPMDHECCCAGEHLRYLNREVRTRNHQASDEGFLDVRIPVAALETFELDPAAVSLQLLDTPGPNEFGEEALKHQVLPRILPPDSAMLTGLTHPQGVASMHGFDVKDRIYVTNHPHTELTVGPCEHFMCSHHSEVV